MEILFLNNSNTSCYIYQYGLRLYNILKKDSYINYIYKEIESQEEHLNILQTYNTVQIIIYNYHVSTMSWLFYTDKNRLNIRITHNVEHSQPEYVYVNNLFNISVSTDSFSGNEYKIPIPDIFKNFEYKEENIIINTFKNIIENFSSSQASQDVFVINCLNKKRHGIYLEIGASCPSGVNNSNTFMLEKIYNWKGLLIDCDISCEGSYKNSRPNSQYIINDARKINYREFLDSNNYPLNIDYLQIDLEVNNKSTLDVLNIFDSSIFEKYKFATVTFEHDIYTGDWFNTRNISREIFKKNGYILVFPDVVVYYGNGYGPFEDWYVHPDLVNMDFINKIKTEKSLFHEDIRKIILNKLKYNEYHGEFLQNKYVDQVLREYFPDPNYKGVFFDVGAFDPIVISNSYHFEKNGWDVYCFEANTDLIKRLKEYRKNVFNYAISNENKERVEFNIVNSGYWTAEFSAIEIGDEYKKICGWNDSFDVKKICVHQKTLNKIIEDEITTIKSIDIISIDIEGGELNCLKGLDINKYKPTVLVIENVINKKEIEDYLKQFNYKLDKKIDYNEYYIKA